MVNIYSSIVNGGVYCQTETGSHVSPWLASCMHFCHFSPVKCCRCFERKHERCSICKEPKKEKSLAT